MALQGKHAEAIEHFRQALRIKPDLAEADTNLARALAQQGKLPKTAEHSQEALSRKAQKVE